MSSSATGPSILLIGAGELGLSILQALLSHPRKPRVSVLLRTSSATDLSSYPVQVVHGDISAPPSDLAPLLSGYDIVVSATGFASGPGTQIRLARAAIEAGIKHYVPWQFGVDYDVIGRGSSQPLFDEQLDVRDLLRSEGNKSTGWTIISTGIFTSFLFHPSFDVVKLDQATGRAVVKALGDFRNRLTITTADDIGRMTSRILLDEVPEREVVFIAGDTVTFDDVAISIEKVGWDVERRVASVQQLEEELEGNKDDVGARYSLIWARGRGVAWDVGETWNGKRGVVLEGLGEWVEKNLDRPGAKTH